MHEMSLCLSMVDLLSERLRAEKAEKVLRFPFLDGALSTVRCHALQTAIRRAAAGPEAALVLTGKWVVSALCGNAGSAPRAPRNWNACD